MVRNIEKLQGRRPQRLEEKIRKWRPNIPPERQYPSATLCVVGTQTTTMGTLTTVKISNRIQMYYY
jgi:hypothetical protein